MSDDTSVPMPRVRNPCCGYMVDHATVIGERYPVVPKPGDFSVCIGCGGWLRYIEDGATRLFDAEDILDLDAEQISLLRRATAAIAELRAEKK